MNAHCTSPDEDLIVTPERAVCQFAHPWSLMGLTTRLKEYLNTLQRRRESRDAFKHLLSLDDALLRDVGVTRADVEWAAQLPLSVNAARALQDCAAAHKRLKDLE